METKGLMILKNSKKIKCGDETDIFRMISDYIPRPLMREIKLYGYHFPLLRLAADNVGQRTLVLGNGSIRVSRYEKHANFRHWVTKFELSTPEVRFITFNRSAREVLFPLESGCDIRKLIWCSGLCAQIQKTVVREFLVKCCKKNNLQIPKYTRSKTMIRLLMKL